jgi:hypothetical protein
MILKCNMHIHSLFLFSCVIPLVLVSGAQDEIIDEQPLKEMGVDIDENTQSKSVERLSRFKRNIRR